MPDGFNAALRSQANRSGLLEPAAWPPYVLDMLIGLLRRVVIVLTGLAFLGGATVQALPPSDLAPASTQPASDATADCAHMAMAPAHHPDSSQPMPCTGVTPDCLKAMGCIGFPNLPTAAGQVAEPVDYGRVAYWSAVALGDGRSIAPILLPPIRA